MPQLSRTDPADEIAVDDSMFKCGPSTDPLPDAETLKGWAGADLLKYGSDAWIWGARCSTQLNQAGLYVKCSIQKDKASCDALARLEEDK